MSSDQYDVTVHTDGRITLTPVTGMGCGPIIGVLLLLIVAGAWHAVTYVNGYFKEKTERAIMEDAEKGFLKGDFLVIEISESRNNRERWNKLVELCEGHFDKSKPLATVERPPYSTTVYYSASEGVGGVRPLPLIVSESTFDSIPLGRPVYTPIYAIFKGSDALGKVRRWGQAEGYENNECALEILDKKGPTIENSDWSITTERAFFEKTGSQAEIKAYFLQNGRFFCWNGYGVYPAGDVHEFIDAKLSIAQ